MKYFTNNKHHEVLHKMTKSLLIRFTIFHRNPTRHDEASMHEITTMPILTGLFRLPRGARIMMLVAFPSHKPSLLVMGSYVMRDTVDDVQVSLNFGTGMRRSENKSDGNDKGNGMKNVAWR